MEFEFTKTIWIEPSDLQEMSLRVQVGENFGEVYDDVMSKYDDCIYYDCGYIQDQVYEAVIGN